LRARTGAAGMMAIEPLPIIRMSCLRRRMNSFRLIILAFYPCSVSSSARARQ
jgi:hypothetical protein